MNSLSWMIYAAGMVDKLGGAALAATIFAGIGGAICLVTGLAPWNEWSSDTQEKRVQDRAARDTFRKVGGRALVAAGATALIAILTPSSSTIYLIAASEAGETVVKSQEAKEVFDDLKTIIKSKLKEQLPKASP